MLAHPGLAADRPLPARCGLRTLANFSTGFPHQFGHISNHAATVAEVLGATGYATFCAGKWHLAHTQDSSAAGPFDQWPLGRGFDRFYGFKGLEQLPVTGRSFAPVMADAGHPATNTLQYFEMAGSRALVAGRWKAVCRHIMGDDFHTEQWELYDLSVDASECDDLAAQRPDKLTELIELWWSEAERNGVLPSTTVGSGCSRPARTTARPIRPAAATGTGRRCRPLRCRPRRVRAGAGSTSTPG